jgi:hypothetical protein
LLARLVFSGATQWTCPAFPPLARGRSGQISTAFVTCFSPQKGLSLPPLARIKTTCFWCR